MPDAEHPDELEGWSVRWSVAVVGAVLSFAFIAVACGGVYAFWVAENRPMVQTWPSETFPAPRLNAKLDSDPTYSFAPPSPFERAPSPPVQAAMQAAAAQGAALDGPPARSPAAMSPAPVAPTPVAARANEPPPPIPGVPTAPGALLPSRAYAGAPAPLGAGAGGGRAQ